MVVDDDGSEFVWIPVPNAIAENQVEVDTMVKNKQYPMAVKTGNEEYMSVLYSYYRDEDGEYTFYNFKDDDDGTECDFKEPAYISRSGDSSSDGVTYLQNILGFSQSGDNLKNAWIDEMKNNFNEMVKQVSSTGGFYISRYEISGEIDKDGNISTKSKPNSEAFTGATKYNDNYNMTWYGLYKAGKSYKHTGIKSTMIWGSQYDQMAIWMAKAGVNIVNREKEKANTDKTLTGVKGSNDVANKVYDLYGGRYEWTMERIRYYCRTVRGGCVFDSGSEVIGYRGQNLSPTLGMNWTSTRATLYCIE